MRLSSAWQRFCCGHGMTHPYPPHHEQLSYKGKQRYFLTFCTANKATHFREADKVDLVRTQILRAASEQQFALTPYCFMPDHLHLIVSGLSEDSDAKAFIARAKQYSGFYFKKKYCVGLWQRFGFERMIRDDMELALTIGYVLANPVRAGLATHPSLYPHLGSSQHSVAELLEICEYDKRVD
jgi:putative transposase